MKNDPKMNKTAATVAKPAVKLDMDPISVAKRRLDEARIDYKRIKEINADPKAKKQAGQTSPEREAIRKQLDEIKQSRKAVITEIKGCKTIIGDRRAQVKALGLKRKELQAGIKKAPRAVKNKAVKEAEVAMLEAELAYRKACIG
jgi:hypothetical protein